MKEPNSQMSRSSSSSDSSENEDYYVETVLQDDSIPCLELSASMASATSSDKSTSIARDVISRKGEYGRFADKWFSRKGWSSERMRVIGMGTNEGKGSRAQDINAIDTLKSSRTSPLNKPIPEEEDSSPKYKISTSNEGSPNPDKPSSIQNAISSNQKGIASRGDELSSNQEAAQKLLPKLLRTTKLLLCSQSFFFSYDYDISKRLGFLENMKSDIPFQKSVDPLVCHFLFLLQRFLM